MSAIKKASGAKNRISKRNKLIKEIASLPGQLKISNIFVKSIETVCRKKSNDSACSIFQLRFLHPTEFPSICLNASLLTKLKQSSNASEK